MELDECVPTTKAAVMAADMSDHNTNTTPHMHTNHPSRSELVQGINVCAGIFGTMPTNVFKCSEV